MPFAFSQIDPRTNGQVSDMEVPMSRYLSNAVDQGEYDSVFHSIGRMHEYSLAETDPGSKLLSPEDANNKYAKPGLKWDKPVNESLARVLSDRHQKELDRQFFLSQDNHNLAAGIAGMGAQMAGSMMNPLDLSLLFLPVVGEGEKLAEGASILGRGMIARSTLKNAFGRGAGTAESVIQGLSYQAVQESAQIMGRVQEGGQANLQDFENLGLGAVFAAGMHLSIQAARAMFHGIPEATKGAMSQRAMDDFVKGRDTDIGTVAKLDPEVEPVARATPPENLPPVEPGFVRMYHGGIDPRGELNGPRHITPHFDYAKGYADKSGVPVWYVDVPEDAPYMKKGFEEFEGGPKAPWINTVAPEDVMRLAKLVAEPKKTVTPTSASASQSGGTMGSWMLSCIEEERKKQASSLSEDQVKDNAELQQKGSTIPKEEVRAETIGAVPEDTHVAEVEKQVKEKLAELKKQAEEELKAAMEKKQDPTAPESHGLEKMRGKPGRQGYYSSKDLEGAGLKGLSVQVDNDRIWLNRLDAAKPGSGRGGEALERLKKLADARGTPIETIPVADTPKMQKGLEKFYVAHGFEPIKGDKSGTWRYEPKTELAQDPIDKFLTGVKFEKKGGQLHAFGIVPEVWNTFVDLIKSTYHGGKNLWEAISSALDWLKREHPGEHEKLPPEFQREMSESVSREETKLHTDVIDEDVLKRGRKESRDLKKEYEQKFSRAAIRRDTKEQISDILENDPQVAKIVEDRFVKLHEKLPGNVRLRDLLEQQKDAHGSNLEYIEKEIVRQEKAQKLLYQAEPHTRGKDVPHSERVWFVKHSLNKNTAPNSKNYIKSTALNKLLEEKYPELVKLAQDGVREQNIVHPEYRQWRTEDQFVNGFIDTKLHDLGFDQPKEIRNEWKEYREDVYREDPGLGYFIDKHYRADWKFPRADSWTKSEGNQNAIVWHSFDASNSIEVTLEQRGKAFDEAVKEFGKKYPDVIKSAADCLTKNVL